MAMGCNKKSACVFSFAGILALAAVITLIVALVNTGESFKVGFKGENQRNITMDAKSDDGKLGYSLHIKASDHAKDCNGIYGKTQIRDPKNNVVGLMKECHKAQEEWETKNDPQLRKLGYFVVDKKNLGIYKISSSVPLWVVDIEKELGEAVEGIGSMLISIVAVVIMSIVSCCLCCVGLIVMKKA